MTDIFNLRLYLDYLSAAENWLAANALVLSLATAGQVIVVGGAFLIARHLAGKVSAPFARIAKGRYETQLTHIVQAVEPLALPITWLTFLWVSVLILTAAELPLRLINLVVSLLTAWVVIRLSTSLVRDAVWSRFVALVAWTVAAFNILNLLVPTATLLDELAINLGTLRVSLLTLVKGMLLLSVLLWLAALTGRLLERRITSSATPTPSLRVLITKLLKIALVIIAVIATLRAVGIDLTAFAVLTGAIGVGIGFGPQKAVANFVSGITIPLDKSIKPGDVIEVGATYGRVHSPGARYASVSVITRDGTEYLIPNEELVTRRVVNWSYSSDQVRLD